MSERKYLSRRLAVALGIMAIADVVVGASGNLKYFELYRSGQLPFAATWIERYTLWSSAGLLFISFLIGSALLMVRILGLAGVNRDVLKGQLWICVVCNLVSIMSPLAILSGVLLWKDGVDVDAEKPG